MKYINRLLSVEHQQFYRVAFIKYLASLPIKSMIHFFFPEFLIAQPNLNRSHTTIE